MAGSDNSAGAALHDAGDELTRLASRLMCPAHRNLVERPWGGDWLRRYKGIDQHRPKGHMPWGESFEIAAYDDDTEAERFPSRVEFEDGSSLELPDLLARQGEMLLGRAFVDRYGACFPLLPKFLDVRELLSVQGHPAGHTEVYIIIDAEPGATIRLGFSRDIDAGELSAELRRGIEQQAELVAMLGTVIGPADLQSLVAPWFADRECGEGGIADRLAEVGAAMPDPAASLALLNELKLLFWRVLDSMNAIAVEPGQVIYNATPSRLLKSGQSASAEVHALGNPERREILALEIRLPGPTFRAWDNVRFPQREVDVDAAIASLNLSKTSPDEFLRRKQPVAARDGAFVSVDCEFFRVEHLLPDGSRVVEVPASGAHALHCLSGRARFVDSRAGNLGRLDAGRSAFVPQGIGSYRLHADEPAEVIRVTLPEA